MQIIWWNFAGLLVLVFRCSLFSADLVRLFMSRWAVKKWPPYRPIFNKMLITHSQREAYMVLVWNGASARRLISQNLISVGDKAKRLKFGTSFEYFDKNYKKRKFPLISETVIEIERNERNLGITYIVNDHRKHFWTCEMKWKISNVSTTVRDRAKRTNFSDHMYCRCSAD